MVLRYIADSPMATMTALLQDKLKCRSIEQLRLSAHGQTEIPENSVQMCSDELVNKKLVAEREPIDQ